MTEKTIKIKITEKLIDYLKLNHSGQHCPLYWVLSRITASLRKAERDDKYSHDGTIEISEWEYNSLPQKWQWDAYCRD